MCVCVFAPCQSHASKCVVPFKRASISVCVCVRVHVCVCVRVCVCHVSAFSHHGIVFQARMDSCTCEHQVRAFFSYVSLPTTRILSVLICTYVCVIHTRVYVIHTYVCVIHTRVCVMRTCVYVIHTFVCAQVTDEDLDITSRSAEE